MVFTLNFVIDMQVPLNSIKFFKLSILNLPVNSYDYQLLGFLYCNWNTGCSKHVAIWFIHEFGRELLLVPQVMAEAEMKTFCLSCE